MTWQTEWAEWVDSLEAWEVCQEECNSHSMECQAVQVVWAAVLTRMTFSRCSWDNRWEEWMIIALQVSWAEEVEEAQILSEEDEVVPPAKWTPS